jgi:Xaa-Pro aminopeptidase
MAAVTLSCPSQSVQTNLAALRSHLVAHQLDGYLIPTVDEHLNEYLPEVKQRRDWISGFTGSAGDLLVGREQAWLFVDARYYEQADLQVDAVLIQVAKLEQEGQKTLEETLQELGKAAIATGSTFRLGYDPFTLSVSQFRSFGQQVEPCGVTLVAVTENLVDRVRQELQPKALPAYANSPLFHRPDTVTGAPIAKKLQQVREEMAKKNVQLLPVTKLDQIAWLFNLRGWDVPYNPVFIAYAIVTPTAAYLFTNLNRIAPELQTTLAADITLQPYEDYATVLQAHFTATTHVLVDPKRSTMGTLHLLNPDLTHIDRRIVEIDNPIEKLKACKNETELAGMQQANLKASRAKTRTLKWISEQLAAGTPISEQDVAQTVERYYAEEAEFQGLSFNTIAGTGANSSIVHYGTPSPEQFLQTGALLLLDSGAQYASGTTDDTRTIVVGTPTAAQIDRYTAVLKAHINCAMQQFPKGTTGAQLDGITRSNLWFANLDYGHGTGHGVGAFLNVHEGPNGISKRVQDPLEPGMVNSIEPGYYEAGWGGIRIENLYFVKDLTIQQATEETAASKATAKPWYGFESLTYIPFEMRLVDLTQLDDRQCTWLQRYHQAVVEKLSPTFNSEEITWLKAVCQVSLL